MIRKLLEHVLSIGVVAAVLLSLLSFFNDRKKAENAYVDPLVKDYASLTFINTTDPFHRAVFREVLDLYYPGKIRENAAVVTALVRQRDEELKRKTAATGTRQTLTAAKKKQLRGMYLKFAVVYILVMFLTFYGVQTIGTWRFIRARQKAYAVPAGPGPPQDRLKGLLRNLAKALAALILFSPAYVIAYAFKTEINTDTVFFMVLLATLSNGLLITYANKFYTFLVAESRKGYIDTAIVKNLHNDYTFGTPGGIHTSSVFAVRKRFDGHVFGHIFAGARSQYISTLKEQASFLITGLVIIEMALNIHGYLNYEMLRQILYGNYEIVVAIMLLIFITVKLTEMTADVLTWREARKYSNR